MSEQVELYAPKPGSLPWRIVKHLQDQPEGTELGRRAIGKIFAVDNVNGLDAILQLACSRSVLVKGRNSMSEVTWRLGPGECTLASTRPLEETPAAGEEQPAFAPAPAVGKWSPTAPRALSVAVPAAAAAAVPASVARMVCEPVADVVAVKHDTTESLEQAFAEVFGDAAKGEHAAQPDIPPPEPAAAASVTPAPVAAPKAPTPQRKPKRGTAPAKPRPAAKPYLAKIEPQPLADPSRREAELYAAWLAEFNVGHSAVFRLAHMKVVEGAASAFAARTKTRFRIAKLSQYRAGIERTA